MNRQLRATAFVALLVAPLLAALLAGPALAADPVEPTTPTHVDPGAGTAPHDVGHEGGDPTPFAGTIAQSLAAIVVFLVVFWVLKQKAWGPILKGLSDREEKIRRDIEEAEAARARAEATQREYQQQLATAEAKVREVLNKATADAEQVAATIRTQAQQEAQQTRESALKEIDSARREAVRQVHEQAALLATNVAQKILKRNINADDQRDLVAGSLEQMETIKA